MKFKNHRYTIISQLYSTYLFLQCDSVGSYQPFSYLRFVSPKNQYNPFEDGTGPIENVCP